MELSYNMQASICVLVNVYNFWSADNKWMCLYEMYGMAIEGWAWIHMIIMVKATYVKNISYYIHHPGKQK